MKKLTILFLTASAIFAEDKPKPIGIADSTKSEYTKALLDLANAQSGRLSMIEQIKKAQTDSDAAMVKAQEAIQAALQKAAKECGEKSQIDGKQLEEKGVLACIIK